MSKGSGTRSSLLWEVERLLGELDELPQVLLMENVPQVMSKKNIDDFNIWKDFLADKGYKNYSEILNAKDYGVAQNRKRAFMVSLLGDYSYEFPEPIPLTNCMNDYLEDEVDESFFVNTENAQKLIDDLVSSGKLDNDDISKSVRGGWPRIGRSPQMGHDTSKVGYIDRGTEEHESNDVFQPNGVSRTIYAVEYKDPVKIIDKDHERQN